MIFDFCLRWRNHQIINEVVNRSIRKNTFENRKCKVYRGFDPILLSQDRIISIQLTLRSITFIEPKSVINLSYRINIRSDFICMTLYMMLYFFYILPLCFYREKKATSLLKLEINTVKRRIDLCIRVFKRNYFS